jgi:hypothetical protein
MEIKKNFASILLNISNRMIKACTASYLSAGAEEMPKSMKNLR